VASSLVIVARPEPLTLGTENEDRPLLVRDFDSPTTERTGCIDLARFERGCFDTRSRDYRPNELASRVREPIAVLARFDEVTLESVEVIIELAAVGGADASPQLGEPDGTVAVERPVTLPERHQNGQSSLVAQ
jgi:hypothetical protein